MEDVPREKLREIIARFGREVCDDPQRCEGILRDLCSQYRKETTILVSALKERIPADLMNSQHSVPKEVLLARLSKRLQDNLGLAEDAAHWSVDTWAYALGVITTPEPRDSTPPNAVPPTVILPEPVKSEPPRDTVQNQGFVTSPPPVQPQYHQENVYPPQQSAYPPPPQTFIPESINNFAPRNSAADSTGKPAEFAQRLLAALVDCAILNIGWSLINAIFIGSSDDVPAGTAAYQMGYRMGQFIAQSSGIFLLLGWIYHGLMESSAKQATIGKLLLGIVVTDINGQRISFGKSVARHYCKVISTLMLGVGYLMALWTPKKQALHDIITECLVVHK